MYTSLSKYEMTLVVGSRAAQLLEGADPLLSKEESTSSDPTSINYFRQALEVRPGARAPGPPPSGVRLSGDAQELRLRRLDHLVIFRPMKCDGSDRVCAVRLAELDMDIVPNIPDENVMARCDAGEGMAIDPVELDPYDGRTPPFRLEDIDPRKLLNKTLHRSFRVSACDFGHVRALLSTRARSFSGVVLVADGDHALLLQATRVRMEGGVRDVKLHTDGSLEASVALDCVVYKLQYDAPLPCVITHVWHHSASGAPSYDDCIPSGAANIAITSWVQKNELVPVALACVSLCEREVPDLTVCVVGRDAPLRAPAIKRWDVALCPIIDIISFEKPFVEEDVNPRRTGTLVIARTPVQDDA